MHYFKFMMLLAAIGAVRCCTNDEECTIPNMTCNDSKCSCMKGYFLSSDGNNCLPYVTEYNSECSEDAQCEWLGENSHCNFVCRCQEGYRWYLGKCKKYVGLGEQCSDSVDCFDGYNFQSLTCQDKKCVCSEGYYQRGNTDCRKIATEVNGICALDMDCQTDPATVCTVGKCLAPSTTPSPTLFVEENKDIVFAQMPEQSCETNEECEAKISNSECYAKTGTCICKKQYFYSTAGTCIAELGVNIDCKSDSDCVLKPGHCIDGVCHCRDYYFVDDGNRNCVKTMSQNNWNCLSKEWCYALGPYSYCSSKESCQCSKLAELDESSMTCEGNGENDPDMCTDDFQCKYIQNGYCVDEACGCKENYVLTGDRCVPDIGAQCDDDNIKCEIENSECRDGTCQCIDNYIAYDKKACYIKSKGLDDDCLVDIQCSDTVTYSKCLNLTCQCDDDRLPHEDACFIKTVHGSYCNNRLECSLSLGDSIHCRNHLCQCPAGYSWSDNECSSSGIVVGNVLLLVTVMILKGAFSIR